MLPPRIQVYDMKKINLTRTIVKAIENSGLDFKILNVINGRPQHIRIKSFGDIYPSTGTWRDNHGEWHRNGHESFLREIAKIKQPTKSDLEQRVTDLEEYCAHLENELNILKIGMLE